MLRCLEVETGDRDVALEEFRGRPKEQARIAVDYVNLTLDSDGEELITGLGPGGNAGVPVTVEECAHFINMVRKTRERLTDRDVEVVAAELELYAKPRRRSARDRRSARTLKTRRLCSNFQGSMGS